ncbi:MAG TPA: hypothetical protein VGG39_16605 [Polyangiaceae bacterium]|jgi:hypothetical protein
MSRKVPTPPFAFRTPHPPALAPAPAPAPALALALALAPAPAPALAPAHRTPANDPAPGVPTVEAFARALSDPSLGAYIAATLAPLKLPYGDKADIAASVKDALWRRRGDADPACTMPRMFGLAKTVLDGKIKDYFRRITVERARFDDAPRTVSDGEGEGSEGKRDRPNVVDRLRPSSPMTPERALLARHQLAFVQQVAPEIGLTEDDVAVMHDIRWDENATWETLAAERGTTGEALRKRITRLQAKLDARWKKVLRRKLILPVFVLLLLLLLGLVAIVAGRSAPPPPEPPPPAPTVQVQPPPAPPPVAPTPAREPGYGAKVLPSKR